MYAVRPLRYMVCNTQQKEALDDMSCDKYVFLSLEPQRLCNGVSLRCIATLPTRSGTARDISHGNGIAFIISIFAFLLRACMSDAKLRTSSSSKQGKNARRHDPCTKLFKGRGYTQLSVESYCCRSNLEP